MLAENLVNSPITCKPINSCIAAQEQPSTQHKEGDENGTCSSVGLEVGKHKLQFLYPISLKPTNFISKFDIFLLESLSDIAEVDEDFDVRSEEESV